MKRIACDWPGGAVLAASFCRGATGWPLAGGALRATAFCPALLALDKEAGDSATTPCLQTPSPRRTSCSHGKATTRRSTVSADERARRVDGSGCSTRGTAGTPSANEAVFDPNRSHKRLPDPVAADSVRGGRPVMPRIASPEVRPSCRLTGQWAPWRRRPCARQWRACPLPRSRRLSPAGVSRPGWRCPARPCNGCRLVPGVGPRRPPPRR